MDLKGMRLNSAIKQKKGLHFILGAIIIWSAVIVVHMTSLWILTKKLLTFSFTAPLVPLAYFISKMIHVNYTNKENPLTQLGLLFSFNQMVYLLIAMWIYPTLPNKLVMILAIIFGAYLLLYFWLYQSESYMFLSIVIPLVALLIRTNYPPTMVGVAMTTAVIIFSLMVVVEVKRLPKMGAC